mmetsp:Transcript_35881/g.57640  ORF Transcript_35881/g.57640 Transcript_35881/m.57640 type:complete len:463 (+) Transcript_35881:92-1480(+)
MSSKEELQAHDQNSILKLVTSFPSKHKIAADGISPDGNTIVTTGWDKTIRFFTSKTGTSWTAQKAISAEHSFNKIAFSPDSKFMLAGGSQKLIKYQPDKEGVWSETEEVKGGRYDSNIMYCLKYLPDQKGLCTSGGSYINLFRVGNDGSSFTLEEEILGDPDSQVTNVEFSPEGHTMVMCGYMLLKVFKRSSSDGKWKMVMKQDGHWDYKAAYFSNQFLLINCDREWQRIYDVSEKEKNTYSSQDNAVSLTEMLTIKDSNRALFVPGTDLVLAACREDRKEKGFIRGDLLLFGHSAPKKWEKIQKLSGQKGFIDGMDFITLKGKSTAVVTVTSTSMRIWRFFPDDRIFECIMESCHENLGGMNLARLPNRGLIGISVSRRAQLIHVFKDNTNLLPKLGAILTKLRLEEYLEVAEEKEATTEKAMDTLSLDDGSGFKAWAVDIFKMKPGHIARLKRALQQFFI